MQIFINDIRGTFAFHVWWIKIKTSKLFYSVLSKVYLSFRGIKIGSHCIFHGKPYAFRFPESKIEIGNSCEFISNNSRNFRGINHPCILQTGTKKAKIIIGDNCGFSGVSIVADKLVKLGNHVTVGANAMIGDRDDHSDIYPSQPKEVIIDDNVWIGMNVTILKGVHIGENSIIGACSVVTKDVPANVIAVGNPCKVIKSIISE